jgi:hypothetical protein
VIIGIVIVDLLCLGLLIYSARGIYQDAGKEDN